MTAWQPIETAPKDGTEIDLWAERWDNDEGRTISKRMTGARWAKNFMRDKECWFIGNTTVAKHWRVTHWMAVPKPPGERTR